MEAYPTGGCESCVAACCRARVLTMPLSKEEADNLRAVGTVLKEFLPADPEIDWSNRRQFKANSPDKRKFVKRVAKGLDPGQGLFGLETDCGFLEETSEGSFVCSVHEDSSLRPSVCGDFPVGNSICRDARRQVLTRMYEDDELVPDFASVALGQTALRSYA